MLLVNGIKSAIVNVLSEKETELNENLFHNCDFGYVSFDNYDFATDTLDIVLNLEIESNTNRHGTIRVSYRWPSKTVFNKLFWEHLSGLLTITNSNDVDAIIVSIRNYFTDEYGIVVYPCLTWN